MARECVDTVAMPGLKAPFPWFGGKSRVADVVWRALGDVDNYDVANDVRQWCIANGDNPRYRIVLAGYDNEHCGKMPDGWRVYAWKSHGGMANRNKDKATRGKENKHRERLWFSPHCLVESQMMASIFAEVA